MIQLLNQQEFHDALDRIADIQMVSFDGFKSKKDLKEQIMKISEYPGFKCYISHQFGNINGYLYGYNSSNNQFYRVLIDKHLDAAEKELLNGAFEIASFAVDPATRHSGVGTQLISALEPGTYYLTSDVHNIPANTFYYRNDFKVLKRNLHLDPSIPEKHLYFFDK